MKKIYFAIMLLVFSIIISPGAMCEDSITAQHKTVNHETKEIDLAKISLVSTSTIFNLKKEILQVISDDNLLDLKNKVDIVVAKSDSLLKYRKDSYLEMKNIRNIKNLIRFWEQELHEIQDFNNKILKINNELDQNRLKYARELDAWHDIKIVALKYHYDNAVIERINQVMGLLDTAVSVFSQKSNLTLGMLDKIEHQKLEIIERIDQYDKILINKQKNIFKTGHPNIFALDYSNPDLWKIKDSFQLLHRGEVEALFGYFKNHITTLIFHFVLLIFAMLILVYIKKTGIPEGENEDFYYRRSLKIIISNPINSAVILGLFASAVLYSNKPILFLDFFKIVVSVPLAVTLINLSHRKYWSIIIAFEILIILQVINTSLSTHLVLSRFLLLITAIIEIITLSALISKIRISKWNYPFLLKIVMILCWIHLVLAFVGFITNIVGKVILTQSLLNAVSGTALAIILIFLALLVGNGLMMLFVDSKIADHINVIKTRRRFVKKFITRVLQLFSLIYLGYYILEAYGFEIYFGNRLLTFFQQERIIGSVTFSWGKVVLFFIIIWLSVFVSRLIKIIVEEEILDRMNLSRGLPNTIAQLLRYTLVTMGVLGAISFTGIKMTSLTIIIGAMSVGIGFGLQNIFNNLVSGLILLLERPIKIGDTIEVGPLVGIVKKIGIRASNVQTLDGAEIIVPNGNLIASEVINWTLSDRHRRIEVKIGIAYGTDPYKAQEVFHKVLADNPEVLPEPKPSAFFTSFGDSSLVFSLLFWTANFDEWIRVKSEITFKIHDALKDAGIEIPFPQHDLHIRTIDKEIVFKNQ